MVLDARTRFHPAGGIDSVRPGDSNRLGDVVRRQTSCQDQPKTCRLFSQLRQRRPVERLARSAEQVGRMSVDQQRRRQLCEVAARRNQCRQVLLIAEAYPQGANDRRRSQLGHHFGRLIPVQLHKIEVQQLDLRPDLGRGRIDEHAYFRDVLRYGFDDVGGASVMKKSRARRVKVQPDGIGARLDSYGGIDGTSDAANFDAKETHAAIIAGERIEGNSAAAQVVSGLGQVRRKTMKPSPFAELPPVLDDIRIASPCSANWEEMTGDDRVRFCSHCQLSVYNLSAIDRQEAEQVVKSRSGRLCVRFYRRADGTMLTQDCPVGLQAIRRRVRRVVCLTLATAVSLLSGVGYAWTKWRPRPIAGSGQNAAPEDFLPNTLSAPVSTLESQAVMGKMAAPPAGGWAMGGCPAP